MAECISLVGCGLACKSCPMVLSAGMAFQRGSTVLIESEDPIFRAGVLAIEGTCYTPVTLSSDSSTAERQAANLSLS